MTLEDATKVLAIEYLHYANSKLSKELIKSWYDHFKEFEAQMFQAAFREAASLITTGWPPVPGQVLAQIRKAQKDPLSFETAEMAWTGALEGTGSKRALKAAKLLGDFENRNHWDFEKDWPWKERDFKNIYNSLKESDESEEIKENLKIEAPDDTEAKQIMDKLKARGIKLL